MSSRSTSTILDPHVVEGVGTSPSGFPTVIVRVEVQLFPEATGDMAEELSVRRRNEIYVRLSSPLLFGQASQSHQPSTWRGWR